jgi:hypothetical protein
LLKSTRIGGREGCGMTRKTTITHHATPEAALFHFLACPQWVESNISH